MTFSYTGPDGTGVFAEAKDETRFLSRDTVLTAYSIADEELMYYLLAEAGSTRLAAADALDARATAIEAAQKKEVRIGPFLTQGDTAVSAQGLRALADGLRNGTTGGPNAPVVSLDGDGAAWQQPVFALGMDDAPGGLPGTTYWGAPGTVTGG